MPKLIMCQMTKVEMIDKVLKKCGMRKGKSKYSDGNITKKEIVCIYNYIIGSEAEKCL